MEIAPERLAYEDIRQRANDFLSTYHPERSIPVPIEEIIEFQLGMDIVPMDGLQQLIGAEGFLYSNFEGIAVDEAVFNKYENRYRFTLAHEIGHWYLHKKMYDQYQIGNITERLDFAQSIPEEQYGWFEWQAYSFGGMVLVPGEKLKEVVSENVKLVTDKGISLKKHGDFAWEYISKGVAKSFRVSSQVVEKRIAKDDLKKLFT